MIDAADSTFEWKKMNATSDLNSAWLIDSLLKRYYPEKNRDKWIL